MKAADDTARWVRVEERLPDVGTYCLVVLELREEDSGRVETGPIQKRAFWMADRGGWRSDDGYKDVEFCDRGYGWHVTHWALLPAPPEEAL